MQQKIIISFIVTLFIASTCYLAVSSYRKQDSSIGKNWWVLYFEEPTTAKLDFSIENYSDSNIFSWNIISKKQNSTIASGKESIAKGEIKKIYPDVNNVSDDAVIINATTDQNETKEIYKNID